MPAETVLYTDHPRMFRNHPVRFVIMALLTPLGIGAIMLGTWYLRCIG